MSVETQRCCLISGIILHKPEPGLHKLSQARTLRWPLQHQQTLAVRVKRCAASYLAVPAAIYVRIEHRSKITNAAV